MASDIHVALDLATAGRVRVLLGGLGHHGVAVVVEPIDQRSQRRVLLVLDQCRIVEGADEASLGTEDIEQALVVYVELQRARRGVEIGTVDEQGDFLLWIKYHRAGSMVARDGRSTGFVAAYVGKPAMPSSEAAVS